MLKQMFGVLIMVAGSSGAAAAESCTLPAIVDTAALQPIPATDLVTVPVEINGKPEQFLLDIGTDPTEVSQAAVAKIGLPQAVKLTESIGAGNANGGGGSNMMPRAGANLSSLTNYGLGNVSVYDVRDNQGSGAKETHVRIAAFTIGNATAKNMTFMVANDADMGKSEPYDGLLTGDFFRQYDIELDFAGKQINWLTPTKCTDPDQVVFWPHHEVGTIPISIAGGRMQVPVMAGGHSLNAVIDTSSPRTLMRRDIAELILGLKAGTDMAQADGLTDGKGQPVYVHTFPQISFAGGVIAQNVPALILANSLTREINSEKVLGSWARSADAPLPDLTLGMDVLRQLHLYVVPGQGKLYVTAIN